MTLLNDEKTVGTRATTVSRAQPLHRCVTAALGDYFHEMAGQPVRGLYDLVMAEVERPLLESVMREVQGNQCRAAAILGLSRTTLRKKLKLHELL